MSLSATLHFLALLSLLALTACMRIETLDKRVTPADPPIMSIESVQKPYVKVATIQTARRVLGSINELDADDLEWGYRALRKEACRVGADAVLFPEISTDFRSFSLIPYTVIKAKAIAVRFDTP